MSTICGRPSDALFTSVTGMPWDLNTAAVPRVHTSAKPSATRSRATCTAASLSDVAYADEGAPVLRQLDPGGELRLDERLAERFAHAHHLAGGLHFRSEDGVDSREAGEREHRFLHREVRRRDFLGALLRRGSCPPCSARRSWLAAARSPWIRKARCASARVHFQHVHVSSRGLGAGDGRVVGDAPRERGGADRARVATPRCASPPPC